MENETNFFESGKKWLIGIGAVALTLLVLGIFFFSYYKVTTVTVMDSNYYSEAEIKKMILDGPFADNSVLAPLLYSKDGIEDIPFITGYSVTAQSRDTICITLKEKLPVGCMPYLDQYIYFDRDGKFIESSFIRDEKIPYFDGITLEHVIKGEVLPLAGKSVFNTAIALASIFRKNAEIPNDIQFDSANNITLIYGDIEVRLGKDQYLEDKMARVLAILPKLEGESGILHMESITDNVKIITFERVYGEITADNWPGGYDETGDFVGDGEYDKNGRYVGPRPKTEYDYALEAWPGGYDEDLDYTGWGNLDKDGEYVGERPTRESIAEQGDWLGGYDAIGRYITVGEYDRNGNYLGPNPNWPAEESYEEYKAEESDYDEDEDYDDEDYNYDDDDDYDEDYDEDEDEW